MNTLKAIENYSLNKNPSPFSLLRKFRSRHRSTPCFCNSDDSGSGSSPSSEGDKRKQELLARIAMLQTQKVRLTNFLDERSAYLTQFAEDANAEFDEIGEKAMKELDDAGARIMEKLEGRMQAFEETADLNREEIEKNEKVLEEFEDQIEKDRNEGLFFKNLGLMSLLAITIANAILATKEVEWGKVAALMFIFMGLLAQFIYEQSLNLKVPLDIIGKASYHYPGGLRYSPIVLVPGAILSPPSSDVE